MANIRWQGNVSGAWNNAGNWIGGLPADGDTVEFLIADLGVNRCAVGPVNPVTLISITDDAGYGGGVMPTICYPNITVTTVSCLSDARLAGGTVETANLSGANSAIDGPTIITTANLTGHGASVVLGIPSIMTLNLNGTNQSVPAAALVATANLNGVGAYLWDGVYGTVNMNGSAVQFRPPSTATTVYVNSLNAEVSATSIAAGDITNGPYVRSREAVLYDYDTGEVMCDTNQVLEYAGGRW